MPNAIRFHHVGGPEVLQFESVSVGDPAPGEVRLRHTAVGLNYIDTYQRSGLYKLPLPSGIGSEAAGVVEAVGSGVSELKKGDRVAYSGGPPGAYAEVRVMPIDRLVKLPDGVSDRTAATLMLKGLTVQYLLRQTYPVKTGETILLHAAAGGIGLIACQWARALGVTVIGTVGSDAKAELAKANGCTHTIVYTRKAQPPGGNRRTDEGPVYRGTDALRLPTQRHATFKRAGAGPRFDLAPAPQCLGFDRGAGLRARLLDDGACSRMRIAVEKSTEFIRATTNCTAGTVRFRLFSIRPSPLSS